MKIAYVTNVRLPTERAHGHQVAQVCDALVGLGHEVTIFAPYRNNPVKEDFKKYYGIKHDVRLELLGHFDAINRWWLPGVIGLWTQNWLLRKNIREALKGSFDVIYTRSPALLSVLLETGKPVILELHTIPNRGVSEFNKCTLIVCLTSPMRDELVKMGVDEKKIIVEGDAVDLELFKHGLAHKHDVFTVGYAGSIKTMGHDKGVNLIAEAVDQLRSQGSTIAKAIAGGPVDAMERMKSNDKHPEEYKGLLKREELSAFYASCDVLIYPAPKTNHPYFMRDTSPLKIFEYMAAGRPIITADLPPIRDVLDESTAYFFEPGNSKDLARAIKEVMDNPSEAQKKAVSARKKVAHYTWPERMKRICERVQG